MATGELFLAINTEPEIQVERVDREKYEIVRNAILENLRSYGSLTFTQLGVLVEEQLQNDFEGSVMWYYTTVKLDMEACGEIRRVPNSELQLIEVVG